MPSVKAAYEWAIKTCNDPNVRYSTDGDKRNGNTVGKYTYYDCSSFIYFALRAGGWTTSQIGEPSFYTGTEETYLERAGWEKVSASGTIKAGDIGWTRNSKKHHTEMAYSDGKNGKAVFMGAHYDKGIAGANQVCIGFSTGNKNGKSSFAHIWRYPDSDMDGAEPIEHKTTPINQYVVAAMCGNFWEESTVNPGAWESLVVCDWKHMYFNNTGGYGLGQWTNTSKKSMRCYDLYCWLTNAGYSVKSGTGQCAYIIAEDHWNALSAYSIKSLTDFLTSESTDLSTLCKTWQHCWEGLSSTSQESVRLEDAQNVYSYLNDHKDDNVSWIANNSFLSSSNRYNNCVCIYQWFNDWYKNNGYGGTDNEDESDDYGLTGTELNSECIQLTWYDILMALAAKGKNSGNGAKVKFIRTRK